MGLGKSEVSVCFSTMIKGFTQSVDSLTDSTMSSLHILSNSSLSGKVIETFFAGVIAGVILIVSKVAEFRECAYFTKAVLVLV